MGPKKIVKSKSEWSERVVAIERVTKVVKGGKKMSFRAIIVVGNEQGKVGVGVGKAGDVITAVNHHSIESVDGLIKLAHASPKQLLLKVDRGSLSAYLVIDNPRA